MILRTRWPCVVFVLACACIPAAAQQQYVVAQRYDANAYLLADLNGDGDALDAGETTLWATGFSSLIDLRRFGSSVLAMDRSAHRVYRLIDLNGDGDALDAGESVLWADGFDNGYGLAVGVAAEVYVAEYGLSQVWRLKDLNGDGDALDAGERTLYAEGMSGAMSVLATHSGLFAAAYSDDRVYLLKDLNGDGDALDANENVAYTPTMGGWANGLVAGPGGVVLVGSRASDAVYCLNDLNHDGDALEAGETAIFADAAHGGLDGPWNMAPQPAGGWLLAETYNGQVAWMRDLNGDGDALDDGEVTLFASGLGNPSGLEALRGPGPAGCMIQIQPGPGTLDAGSPSFLAIVDGSTLGNSAIVSALNADENVLISTDNPYGFEPGAVCQDANAPLAKTAGGAAWLAIRADESIRLSGGVSSSSGPLAVSLFANDDALAYRDANRSTGDVILEAAIETYGGAFAASGVNFSSTAPGDIRTAGGAITMTFEGQVSLAGDLMAGSGTISVTAPGGVFLLGNTLGGRGSLDCNVVSHGGTIHVPAGTLALHGSLALADSDVSTKSGDGNLVLAGPLDWGNDSAVLVKAGWLRYELAGQPVTVGSGASLVIDPNGAAAVGGDTDPFTDSADATRHVEIANDGLFLVTGHSVVESVLPQDPNVLAGTTYVDANASLTVTRIIQGSLIIGPGGKLTIGGCDDSASVLAALSTNPDPGATAVPEPCSLLTLVLGGLALARRRSR